MYSFTNLFKSLKEAKLVIINVFIKEYSSIIKYAWLVGSNNDFIKFYKVNRNNIGNSNTLISQFFNNECQLNSSFIKQLISCVKK